MKTKGSKIEFTLMVPTMNRPEMLSRCLDSLLAQDLAGEPVEFLVTDDSTDCRTRELISRKYPSVRYNEGPRRGLAANRNSGIQAAKGLWILITDDDCIASPHWAKAFIQATRDFPRDRLFEGRTTPDRPRQRLDEEAPINESGGSFWGCNLALHKETVLALGGFNESFTRYGYEDIDFQVRAIRAGKKTVFVENALIIHPWRPAKSPRQLFASLQSIGQFLTYNPDQQHYFRFGLRFKMATSKSLAICRDLVRFRGRGWFFGLATIAFYFSIPFYVLIKRISGSQK